MKKLLLSMMLLLALFLVACTPENSLENSQITVEDVTFSGNIFEASLIIEKAPESLDLLKELVTSGVHMVYNEYKLEFGQKSYTLLFKVFVGDIEVGDIAYRVNSNIENPGLSYVGDTLELD